MKKALFLLFILTNFLFANIGQITALVGDVKISRDSKTILAKLGEKLEKNDVINSAKASKAQVTLNDNTIITIGQNSTLNIFDYAYDVNKPKDSKASFGFMKGSFKSITGKIGKINKERFKLKTKSASIGIRGTTIIGNQQVIVCTDGAISVTANGITVNVEKQELTRTPQGQGPTPPEPLKQGTLDTLEQQSGAGNNSENTQPAAEQNDNTTDNNTTDDSSNVASETSNSTNDEGVTSFIKKEKEKEINNNVYKKEHSTFSSNFSTLGYVNTIIRDDNTEDFKSFQNGEIGIENFDVSLMTNDSLKINIDDKSITNATLTLDSNGTLYDEPTQTTTMSWGQWNATIGNDSYTGGWIAGTKTAKNIVDNLINGITSTVNFNGNVIDGDIFDGTTVYEILDSSTASFAFDFGGGSSSFTGDLNLTYVVNQQNSTYNIHIGNNGVVNSSGFSSSDLTHNSNSITGNVNGSFYGSGSIKAIGGKFNFKDGVIKGSGLFKATQQQQQQVSGP
jgi:hypothetical protein